MGKGSQPPLWRGRILSLPNTLITGKLFSCQTMWEMKDLPFINFLSCPLKIMISSFSLSTVTASWKSWKKDYIVVILTNSRGSKGTQSVEKVNSRGNGIPWTLARQLSLSLLLWWGRRPHVCYSAVSCCIQNGGKCVLRIIPWDARGTPEGGRGW